MKRTPKAKHKAARNGHLPSAPFVLDPQNARLHSERNKKLIRESLESVGAFRSVGAVRGVVRVGNGVTDEALKLGFKLKRVKAKRDELVVVERDDMTDAEADRAAMLDNFASDSSAYAYEPERFRKALTDDPLLKQIAEEEARYRDLLKGDASEETADAGELVDRAAELQKKWQVKRGEIFVIPSKSGAMQNYVVCGKCKTEINVD